MEIGTRAVNDPRGEGAIYVTKVIARIESVFYVVNSERGAPMPIVGTGIAVREIVRLYAATFSVFDRFNVDFCSEAGLPLRVAASQHNLDLNQFLR